MGGSLGVPDDFSVAILGSQVQGCGVVGVTRVLCLSLQQCHTQVAVQKQLGHLQGAAPSQSLLLRLNRIRHPAPSTQHPVRAPVPRAAGLTLSRPNSQARSRGVFFSLLTRHGLDWCWRSISDWDGGSQVREAGLLHAGPCLAPGPHIPSGWPTYHLIMPILRSQMQRDLAVQRGSIDSRRSPQQKSHGLQAALPGCIVEGTHA